MCIDITITPSIDPNYDDDHHQFIVVFDRMLRKRYYFICVTIKPFVTFLLWVWPLSFWSFVHLPVCLPMFECNVIPHTQVGDPTLWSSFDANCLWIRLRLCMCVCVCVGGGKQYTHTQWPNLSLLAINYCTVICSV